MDAWGRRIGRCGLLVCFALLGGCPRSATPADGGADARGPADIGPPPVDARPDAPTDAGPPDVGPPPDAGPDAGPCDGVCAPCSECVGDVCQPVDDGTPCGEGTCHDGACCAGCWDGSTCLPGRDRAACGVGGQQCLPCPCDVGTCDTGECLLPDGAACPMALWSRGAGMWVNGLAFDGEGNLYVAAEGREDLDLGEGPVGSPVPSAVIASYTPEGTLRWSQVLSPAIATGVALDRPGRVIVTGRSIGIDLGDGPVAGLMVIDFDLEGHQLWYRAGGSGFEFKVAVQGAVVHVGARTYGTVDLGCGPISGHPYVGGLYLARLRTDDGRCLGQALYSETLTGTGEVYLEGIAADGLHTFVTGWHAARGISLGGDPLPNYGDNDAFLAVYSPDGTHIRSVAMGGTGSDAGTGIVLNSAGGAVMAGFMGGTATLGALGPRTAAGTHAGFLVRVDADTERAASVLGDGEVGIGGAAPGPGGNLYVLGSVQGSLTLAGDALESPTEHRMFVAAFDALTLEPRFGRLLEGGAIVRTIGVSDDGRVALGSISPLSADGIEPGSILYLGPR